MEYEIEFLVMILLFIIFNLICSSKEFLNYVDINFIQTASIYDSSIFSGGLVNGSLSFSYDVNEKTSFYLSYILNYDGVSFWNIERDIKERSIKQSIVFETHYFKKDNLRLRPQLFLSFQKFRDSAVSSYEDNIYNNNINGFGFSFDFLSQNPLTVYLNYRRIRYPNYTDLLTEISYGLSFIKSGVYDKNVYEIGLRLKKNNWFFDFSYTFFSYLNQKVINETSTYSSTNQEDKNISFIVGREKIIHDELFFYPSIKLDLYYSNQNYLKYKTFLDVNPRFVKDAFSYIDFSLDLPFNLKTKDYSIGFGLGIGRRSYISRPPLNSNNEYKNGKQYINHIKFSVEIAKNITELAYYKFGYVLLNSSSNNEFERYIPYNYTNHTFYLGYGIRY